MDKIIVTNVAFSDAKETLSELFVNLTADERTVRIEHIMKQRGCDPTVLDGLFEARIGSRRVGVAMGRTSQGKTAFLDPPMMQDDAPPQVASKLFNAVDTFLAKSGVRMIECIIDTQAHPNSTILSANGYEHITDAFSMLCHEDSFPGNRNDSPLEFQEVKVSDVRRLEKVVTETFIDSLDCPGLVQNQEISMSVEGFLNRGSASEIGGIVGKLDRDEVACVFVAEHPALQLCELTYFGVVPRFRGRGIGLEMVQHAQRRTRTADRSRLIASVDVANRPAIRIYERAGFHVVARSHIFVKSLG